MKSIGPKTESWREACRYLTACFHPHRYSSNDDHWVPLQIHLGVVLSIHIFLSDQEVNCSLLYQMSCIWYAKQCLWHFQGFWVVLDKLHVWRCSGVGFLDASPAPSFPSGASLTPSAMNRIQGPSAASSHSVLPSWCPDCFKITAWKLLSFHAIAYKEILYTRRENWLHSLNSKRGRTLNKYLLSNSSKKIPL